MVAGPSLRTKARELRGLPESRPRGRIAFAVPLVLAAFLGLAAGLAPRPTLVVTVAAVVALLGSLRLEWACLTVIGAAVFEDYLNLLSPWTTEALAALLLMSWLVRRSGGPLHEHRNLPVLVPAGIFAVTLLLATAAHLNGQPGLAVCARYVEFLVVFLVLTDTLSAPLAARRAAKVFVWSAVAASLCGMLTAVAAEQHRIAGPLADPSDLAFFLLVAVPLAAALRQSARRTLRYDIAFVVLVLATVGTLSRGAIIALTVMVLVAVLTRVLPLRLAGGLLVLLGTGAAFAIAVLLEPVGQQLDDDPQFAETRVSQRLDLWEVAVSMTRDQPVLGLGPGGFALYHQDYSEPDGTIRELDGVHSTPLEASAELGVLGAGALLSIFVVPAVAVRRRWRHSGSPLAAAAAVGLVGALVASTLETAQYLLPLWFLAALALALSRESRREFPLFSANSSGQSAPVSQIRV